MENSFKFPKYFLWGAVTSSHQVEGNNMNNDWWGWEQNGKVKERAGKACDHWNRYCDDFALAKSLHHNAHRFSLEWSRIEPHEGEFSEEAIAHYREVIESLKSNSLEPVVTLHHFTLPLWLAQKGGWLFDGTSNLFARYVRKVIEALGEHVRYWITLNEPVAYVFKSYLMGEWPPGEKSYEKTLQALSHLLKGHVLAYDTIKEVNQRLKRSSAQVGIAKHVLIFTPCSPKSWKDRLSVGKRNFLSWEIYPQGLYWAEGYAPRFGLVEVDYATQTRKIRESAKKFAGICKSGKIDYDE